MSQKALPSTETDGPSPSAAGSGAGAFLLRATVSVLLFACLATQFLTHPHVFPFRLHFASFADGGVVRIEPRSGLALPPPLHAGESLPLALQPFSTRLALALGGNVSSHRALRIVLDARGRRFATVRSVRSSTARLGGRFQRALHIFSELFFFTVGMLTLWWGRNWAAWGFSLAILPVVGYQTLSSVPWPAVPEVLPVPFLLPLFGGIVFYIGLYLSVRTLLGHRVRFLHGRDLLYLLLVLLGYALELESVVKVLSGIAVPLPSLAAYRASAIVIGAIVLVQILAIVHDLVRGYNRAGEELRLRLRWVLLAAFLLIPDLGCVLWIATHPVRDALHDFLVVCGTLLVSSIVGLYAYVLLRQRLVEVRMVVSRALVFTLFMAAVVGLFAFVENAIERSAAPRGAGFALELGIPLLLGIFFHRLSRWIERLVERVFFRREYRARQEILEFSRDAGYIEDPAVLEVRTARVFACHSGSGRAALYEAEGEGLRRTASFPDGEDVFPSRLEADDPALVRLRARRSPLDLHGLESALGEGLALPFILRGRPYALLVLGPRPGGRYSEEETDFLARAVHEVGSALLALRLEEEGKKEGARDAIPHPALSSAAS
jgi:hypothetical protein